MRKWSKKYKKCIACETIDQPHAGHGLCRKCYAKRTEKRHGNYKRQKRGIAEDFLTKENLIELYTEKKLSLSDIGKLAGTSRVNVHHKLVKFDIPRRSKKKARTLALDREKLKFTSIDNQGNETVTTLQKIRFNEAFFDSWSNEMAYALGLIYTDGNIYPGQSQDPSRRNNSSAGRLSFGQKEKPLVQKLAQLLNCDGKIYLQKKREYEHTTAGELYYLNISSDKLYNQLMRLGVTPNKSLNMMFPDIPTEYVRHFIRGCWDGDGTVYTLSKSGNLHAGFISGSKDFIIDLKVHLESNGLPAKRLFENKGGKSFYFKYTKDDDCLKLYRYLYDGVPESQYLMRKYKLFHDYFMNFKP